MGATPFGRRAQLLCVVPATFFHILFIPFAIIHSTTSDFAVNGVIAIMTISFTSAMIISWCVLTRQLNEVLRHHLDTKQRKVNLEPLRTGARSLLVGIVT